MGEDLDVVLEKGKAPHIKTLTPGIKVGDLHHDVLDSSICVLDSAAVVHSIVQLSNYTFVMQELAASHSPVLLPKVHKP